MVTMFRILAIDAGGTTTRAVIVEPSGHCLGLGFASSGNPTSGGFDAALTSLASATERARVAARPEPEYFTSAVIAMAGAGLHAPREQIQSALAPFGLQGPVDVVPDVMATFFSGTRAPHGYALIAGTGAVAARIEDGRLAAVADGLGWLLGDEGSGYWIGHRVVTAVVAFLDGRAPQTDLSELLLTALQLTSTTQRRDDRPGVLLQLVDALYALRPVELSRFAPLAFQARDDEIARAILADAASALAGTLGSIRDPGVDGPVVLGGSVATSGLLAGILPGDTPPITVPDGVVGAAVLGLQHAGIRVTDDIFRRITADVTVLRDAARRENTGHQ
jgi:glucosamine kinase